MGMQTHGFEMISLGINSLGIVVGSKDSLSIPLSKNMNDLVEGA